MRFFMHTLKYLMKAQMKTAGFYIMTVIALVGILVPLFTSASSPLTIAICDEDSSQMSRELIASAASHSELKLQQVNIEELPAQMQRVQNGSLEAVFVIPKGYEKNVQNGQYKKLVKLYLSPYSTSASTSSDVLASCIMSQWFNEAVKIKAQEILLKTDNENANFVPSGSNEVSQMIRLDVNGNTESDNTYGLPQKKANNALYILAVIACFQILCFSSGGKSDGQAILERLKSQGSGSAPYYFALAGCSALPMAILSVIPCIFLAANMELYHAFTAFAAFIAYLFIWAVWTSILNMISRGSYLKLTLASTLAIFNAILSFPGALTGVPAFLSLKSVFAGYWMISALKTANPAYLVLLFGYALVLFIAGSGVSHIQYEHTSG